MSTVRLRRLAADFAKLQDYARRHPRIRLVQAQGDPPERYQIEYRIKSVRMVAGELQPVQQHLVEVSLPLGYPRTPPQCRMLSPVFHPNIAPHAICVGDHWSAGESLQSIITRIGEMLAYQSYNVKSPLNGEAARWVEQNKDGLPLDPVSLLVDEQRNGDERSAVVFASPSGEPAAAASVPGAARRAETSSPPTAIRAAATPDERRPPYPPVPPSGVAASHVQVHCPTCRTAYRLAGGFVGRSVRCKKCGETFTCAVDGA